MRKKEFQIDDLRVIYIHSTKQATEEAIIVGEDCIMFQNKRNTKFLARIYQTYLHFISKEVYKSWQSSTSH